MAGERTEQICISVTPEKKEEIKQRVEDQGWSYMSQYIEACFNAGESSVRTLDPRTGNSNTSNQETTTQQYVTTEELVEQIKKQSAESGDEFIDIEDIVEPFLKQLDAELSERIGEMAENKESPIVTDYRGGYKSQ